MMWVPGGTRRAALEVIPATHEGVGGHARANYLGRTRRRTSPACTPTIDVDGARASQGWCTGTPCHKGEAGGTSGTAHEREDRARALPKCCGATLGACDQGASAPPTFSKSTLQADEHAHLLRLRVK